MINEHVVSEVLGMSRTEFWSLTENEQFIYIQYANIISEMKAEENHRQEVQARMRSRKK